MQKYKYSGNYDDPVLAELYDRFEAYTNDIELLQRLIGNSKPLNILECFSGTGRILIPLAMEGHRITGIEISKCMNNRAVKKIDTLDENIQKLITLKVQDVLNGDWGSGYDLIIMGANAFFELSSSQQQERCIELAHEALVPEGLIFIDNNDYKGDWGKGPFGKERIGFEGYSTDGTHGKGTAKDLRFDDEHQVLEMKHTWYTRSTDGKEIIVEYLCSKHPVSAKEVKFWLKKYSFHILKIFGDRQGNPYTMESNRAIFWAKKS